MPALLCTCLARFVTCCARAHTHTHTLWLPLHMGCAPVTGPAGALTPHFLRLTCHVPVRVLLLVLFQHACAVHCLRSSCAAHVHCSLCLASRAASPPLLLIQWPLASCHCASHAMHHPGSTARHVGESWAHATELLLSAAREAVGSLPLQVSALHEQCLCRSVRCLSSLQVSALHEQCRMLRLRLCCAVQCCPLHPSSQAGAPCSQRVPRSCGAMAYLAVRCTPA